MCLDWNTLEAFECDSSFRNACGSDSKPVYFPEGSGDEASTCSLASSPESSPGSAIATGLSAMVVIALMLELVLIV